MDRRGFLTSMLAGAAGVALGAQRWAAAGRKPNIIFILADDLGWRDTGFTGSSYYETPHIDRLSKQGMVFGNAYAAAPNCAPSRASLLSGEYTPRHGVLTVHQSDRSGVGKNKKNKEKDGQSVHLDVPESKPQLGTEFITFAEALKPAGYVSASIGKWHLGNDPHDGPHAQGFDVNIAGSQAGAPPEYFSPYRLKDLSDGPKGEYLTDRLTEEAVKFIRANKDRPFLLYLTHYAVHAPLQAVEELEKKFKGKKPDGKQRKASYAGMIASLDNGVGKVLDVLDELKLADETVVFFTSDNGGSGKSTSNAPLRGEKGMLYEGGVREPFCVRWPGKIKPGTACETPISLVDIYPTMLEIAGCQPPKNYILDGESIMPLMAGKGALKRKAIFWYFPCYLDTRATPCAAVRQGDWKLLLFFEDNHEEVYNLKADPYEEKDLAQSNPDKRKELSAALQKWLKDTNAVIPKRK